MSLEATMALVAGFAVLLRALFVAADAALTGTSPERARELVQEKPTLARRSLALLKRDLEGTAATVRGISVGAIAIAAALAGVVSLRMIEFTGAGLPSSVADVLAAASGGAACALAAFFIDLIPRSLAIVAPEAWAVRLAIPVRAASFFLAAPARLVRALLDKLLFPFGARTTFKHASPALEDIERLLEEEARTDEDAPAPELVRSLFEFSTLIAREVMIPRTDVIAVSIDASYDELVRLLAEQGHSRLPVYQGDIDQVVGVLHTRDLVPLLAHPTLIKLADVLRTPVFVPWAMRIGHLLRDMQKRRIHMAIVTDEYGGFMGLVTLEDILEQIVGDIRDEHDDPEPKQIEPQPDGTLLVRTAISLDEFNEATGSTLPLDDGYETLGGFLNHMAGEIPEVGAKLQSHGLLFTVAERTPRGVRRVRVSKLARLPLPEMHGA